MAGDPKDEFTSRLGGGRCERTRGYAGGVRDGIIIEFYK
jgi:hypothetical protein